MSFLESIANTITHQSSKQHQLFLATVIGTVLVGLSGIIYFLYMQRDADVATLIDLQEASKKNNTLIAKSDKIKAEEERIKALLEENKGFSIKTFFETLTREQKLTAEAGWDTEIRSIEGNDTFDEIVLSATFKNQTTQALVALLGVLDNNEIVYIKELEIKKEAKKTIAFTLTIATKKRKQFWED
jgi:hypothetical protein